VEGGQQPPGPPPLWVSALGEEIARTGSAPLSLLLAELEDADRVLATESEPDVTFGEFTHALRRAVRRQDMLVSETAARAWVIARDTDRMGARALAERISGSVRDARPWRGAPMVASVGYAVLGEDGTTPPELIDAAEQARFMAAATGTV
jgi:GGDEF domain-containing protein